MPTAYHALPAAVRSALDERGVEDSDPLSPKECFEEYCNWHGIIGWNLWELMKQCEAAEVKSGELDAQARV